MRRVDVEEEPVIRVVVVDDHVMLRRELRNELQAPDVAVVAVAQDGIEAVEVVREHLPDVVLMDLSMPRMGGIAASRSILAEHPQIRVIVLTSFIDPQQVRECLQAGVIGYHLKDFHPGALLAAVRAAAADLPTFDARVGQLGPRRGPVKNAPPE